MQGSRDSRARVKYISDAARVAAYLFRHDDEAASVRGIVLPKAYQPSERPMVVVIFYSRLKPGVEKEVAALGGRMYALGSAMPGFVSYRDYTATDGESVAIVEFESRETLAAWRNHPEHREAQAAGRNRFFSEYRITVCEPLRDYSFP
jgi:heme-degrading monooxygenase HmoA